jgi:hypothetical protein
MAATQPRREAAGACTGHEAAAYDGINAGAEAKKLAGDSSDIPEFLHRH